MLSLESCFSDKVIVKQLAGYRLALADRRSKKLFLRRLSRQQAHPEKSDLPEIFPPRRQWAKFRPKRRGAGASSDANRRALERAMHLGLKLSPRPLWAQKLSDFIDGIRSQVLTGAYCFEQPTVRPEEKNRAKGEYRPVSSLHFEDKLVDALIARYLRETLDLAFDEASYAFRASPKKAQGSTTPVALPTTHAAVEKILRVRKRHSRVPLFVAECDIRGFFDCVCHTTARTALKAAIRDAERKWRHRRVEWSFDSRAAAIFDAFLDCYSFRSVVIDVAQPVLKTARGEKAHYKWPEEDLAALHGGVLPIGVGVPQGGAISCVIANLVLHGADKALRALSRRSRPTFTYLRYCDDMVILSSSEASCRAAFDLYQQELTKLRLPYHPAKPALPYDKHTPGRRREHWNGKSKEAYAWGADVPTHVPWLQFVGYQIRHDGLLRVRPKSLAKQLRRIVVVVGEVKRVLVARKRTKIAGAVFSSKIWKTKRQILFRLQQRLIAMSVGRRKAHESGEPKPMCWAAGFRLLHQYRCVESLLRRMDRFRRRQIARLKGLLGDYSGDFTEKRELDEPKVLKFYGPPFSYAAQFSPRKRR